MQQTAVPTAVWQRRTNKVIAAGITIIGLTMMLSLIPQCIYIGIVFVTCSLVYVKMVWLGWMTLKEKKVEPPRPEGQHPASPVLFLVASHHLRHTPHGPTLPDPEDKPPTYDQILKLDGLPPDYYSVLSEKPPRYEDVNGGGGWGACALPVELYSHDLACVHASPSTLHHPDSPSFFQEAAASWANLADTPPGYTAAHNPAFASDDSKVFPLLVEAKETPSSASHPSYQPLCDKHELDDDDTSKPPPDMK